MRVDVIDLLLAADAVRHVHRHGHTPHPAFARRRDHVVPVGVGAVTDELTWRARRSHTHVRWRLGSLARPVVRTVNLRAALFGVFELLEHDDAAAARDHEPVTRLVEGARRRLGRVVVLGRERAHRVEHRRELPALVLARAREHDILFAQLDLREGRRAGGVGGERRP